MKVSVIGTGYVGLVGSAIFADWGNDVIGVDIDASKIEKIKSGVMPIYEPGLKEIVLDNMEAKRLEFTTDLEYAVRNSEIVFVCVGTPQDKDGSADLSAVLKVAADVGKYLDSYKVIVTKSTVPVGTNEKVKETIKANLTQDVEFDVASNPEFLREGFSVEDMRNTDRTVVGSDSPKAMQIMKDFYSHLESPIVECDLRSAEVIKYASNSFLATKISFINEMAQFCETAGANVETVAKGIGLDTRIGTRFLQASIGYGGGCFPKDVAALRKTGTDYGYKFNILEATSIVNKNQRSHFVDKVVKYYGGDISGKTFAALGLAFKGRTDDVRESPALDIIELLRQKGAKIKAFDREAIENAKKVLGDKNIEYINDMYEVMAGADALLILTEWPEYENLDLDKTQSLLKEKVIFDGRNILNQNEVEGTGFTYFAIGKVTNGSKKLK